MNTDIKFTHVTAENINQFKKIRKIYANYKIQTLRNHGETPGNKKMFCNLFDGIISRASDSDLDYFIVMQSSKEIVGFAYISISGADVVKIQYDYGSVNDFYISQKYRRKGFGRVLNDYIENIFRTNKTETVLLSPDPVFGIPFWKAMDYCDTGIHNGWGHFFVYIKHLIVNEHSAQIDNAISALVKPVDIIGINPYNKPQIKEVCNIWKEYCKDINRKSHKNDVRKMAWNARKNKDIRFNALYYQGKIIGFTYKADSELNYILPEYRKEEISYEQTKYF